MAPRRPLVVRPVRNGRGIVARRAYRVGELLCRLGGRVVSSDEVWSYWDTDPQMAANCLRYDAERYLNPGRGIGAFSNHSCRPNSGAFREGRWLVFRAIRPIAPGDEVTHDYSTLIGADDIWTMPCNCGERACRGVVRRFDRLPQALVRRYVRLGAIPGFILATSRRWAPQG
jgi:hypothetical protein